MVCQSDVAFLCHGLQHWHFNVFLSESFCQPVFVSWSPPEFSQSVRSPGPHLPLSTAHSAMWLVCLPLFTYRTLRHMHRRAHWHAQRQARSAHTNTCVTVYRSQGGSVQKMRAQLAHNSIRNFIGSLLAHIYLPPPCSPHTLFEASTGALYSGPF